MWNDELVVHTWPHTMERVTSDRCFEICTRQGDVVAVGESSWILVNTLTRRAARVTPEVAEAYPLVDRNVFDTPLRQPPMENGEVTCSCRVMRRDIDTQHHVNNLVYLDYARQALPEEIYDRPFREIAVKYSRQLLLGEEFHCVYHHADGCHLVDIRSADHTVSHAQITLLVATGMHRPTTEAELRSKYGDEIVDNETFVIHKAVNDEDMAFFGTLPSGGELWLNKLVKEADLVVSEGFIEPHFFAGFSGGRKSILPGVASAKTVLYNHNAGFIASQHARQGSLDENPIHRDMLYAAEQAKLAFILNVLIDAEKRVIAAVAGHHIEAHRTGCALCEKLTCVDAVISDIAITSNGGYPLDQNVYQSVKGMTAAESNVRPGGAVIICAALGDGHGGEAFYRWFADRPDAAAVTRDIQSVPPEKTHMDQWEAQILARVMGKAVCWFVTGEENRELVETMHLRWAPDADTALAEATAMLGENASVTVIPDGVGVIV